MLWAMDLCIIQKHNVSGWIIMKRGKLDEGWTRGRTKGIWVILKAMVWAGAFSWYGLAWHFETRREGERKMEVEEGDEKEKINGVLHVLFKLKRSSCGNKSGLKCKVGYFCNILKIKKSVFFFALLIRYR